MRIAIQTASLALLFAFVSIGATAAPAANRRSELTGPASLPPQVQDAAATVDGKEADPAAALQAGLTAACRQNEASFAAYLTVDNAAAFKALESKERIALMKRLSLQDDAGKPLLSSDAQGHTVLRCQTPQGSTEFRFGSARVRENLAFVPVTVPGAQQSEFGMIRENGGWRLLSLGLTLFDIPKLSKQWAVEDLAASEDAAVQTLRGLAAAIGTYRDAFGRLPESLAELGPAPKDQINPEQANLVNAALAAGNEGGYQFRYRIVPGATAADSSFELAASPAPYGKSGRRSFFYDSTGKLYGADKHGAVANSDDPPIDTEKTP
jgi:hypothetical protein